MSGINENEAFEGASLSAQAIAARPAPYLEELNPEQCAAVQALDTDKGNASLRTSSRTLPGARVPPPCANDRLIE